MQTQSSLFAFLGIDPGTRVVGFAVLEATRRLPLGPRDWRVVDVGVLKAPTELAIPARLAAIHQAVFDLMSEWSLSHAAVERAFHGINASSGIKLGEARGAIIAAIGRHGVPVSEFTPAQIKRTVGGSGAATKEQVAIALGALLGFQRGRLPFDASDALAIALTACLNLAGAARIAKAAPAHSRVVGSYSKTKRLHQPPT